MKKYLLLALISFSLFSCATKKEIIYFQDIDALNSKSIEQPFEPIIETNDILYISIYSIDSKAIAPFVKGREDATATNTNANPSLDGYLVKKDGSIIFPVIGDIQVAGSTRAEVVDKINKALSLYIKDPVVDVRIMNFEITILGEVNQPGVFPIRDERVTLPEAIALAGDLTVDGKRENITIVREENGKRLIETIDLTSSDFFNSDFYYLKQNDVIYVQPSLKGVKKSGFIPDVPALLSLFTIVLSSIIIITR
ncbi:polysaccharide biosynthesis protein [Patiriisocius marinistellae]|uniref:Polysaccharide biosynthesis protein n=1 Tax=Patiriisocius marinistellae TaxID=2494560 RepID=A0A5J4G0W8_9FLAO|nr:polysaccharide biosynthesis/export family protein [Patiriisocius marinistellae]GEQ87194.1 polysaccharide biosynthesis protein [Patiriisocius marinistellae]